MNPTTEVRLLAQLCSDNATAYTAFVTGHLGMVFDLAKRYGNGDGVELFHDLVGEGELALCAAARTFPQETLACRFSTYAYLRITRAMVSYRRTDDVVPGSEWSVRVAQKARQHWEEMVAFIQTQEGHPPTREEFSWVFGEQQEMALAAPYLGHGETGLDPDAYLLAEDREGLACRRTQNGAWTTPPTAIRPWSPEADPFSRRVEQLPRDTRLLVEQLVTQYEHSANVSLAQLAVAWHCARQELAETLMPFLELAAHGH